MQNQNFYSYFLENTDKILSCIKDNAPLIHCITNPISINDCANAVLALGAKPIMAEHPDEVAEITAASSALCLNIGNITDARLRSIKLSAETAFAAKIPFVLDVVGITCSTLRFNYTKELLKAVRPTVIKGNLSEIKKLANASECHFTGVDSEENTDTELSLINAAKIIKALAASTGSIIAASGSRDIISDGSLTAVLENGSPALARVTGTGCMLNVIIGTMLAAQPAGQDSRPDGYDAFPDTAQKLLLCKVILGTAILGICGELAEAQIGQEGLPLGLGTYHINLINALSAFTSADIKKRVKLTFL